MPLDQAGGTESLFDPVALLGLLAFFILLFLGAYYLRKYFSKRGSIPGFGPMQGKYMKVLDFLPLAKDHALALVQVGEHALLLGLGAGQVQTLLELPLEELELLAPVQNMIAGDGGWITRALSARKTEKGAKKTPADPFGPLLRQLTLQQEQEIEPAGDAQQEQLLQTMQARVDARRHRQNEMLNETINDMLNDEGGSSQ